MEINLEAYNFFIKPGITDMRKGSPSLAYIVQNEMKLEPFSKAVFLFCGGTKRTIKAIVWDRNHRYHVQRPQIPQESLLGASRA